MRLAQLLAPVAGALLAATVVAGCGTSYTEQEQQFLNSQARSSSLIDQPDEMKAKLVAQGHQVCEVVAGVKPEERYTATAVMYTRMGIDNGLMNDAFEYLCPEVKPDPNL